MNRGQLDDRWKEIRGKVALIFHLLITTKALPPTSGTAQSHPPSTHTDVYMCMCTQPVLSWRTFHLSPRQTGKIL